MNDDLPLKDIHLPEVTHFDFMSWLFIISLMVGSIICLYLLANWLKGRNAQKASALLELDKIFQNYQSDEGNEQQKAHEYIKQLSLLIRRYIYSLNDKAPIHLPQQAFYEWINENGFELNLDDDNVRCLIYYPYRSLDLSSQNDARDALKLNHEKIIALNTFAVSFIHKFEYKAENKSNLNYAPRGKPHVDV